MRNHLQLVERLVSRTSGRAFLEQDCLVNPSSLLNSCRTFVSYIISTSISSFAERDCVLAFVVR